MDAENYSSYFLTQAFSADPFSVLSSSASAAPPPFPSSHDSVQNPISLQKYSHFDFPINPSQLLPSLCSLEHPPPPLGNCSSAPKRLRLPTPAPKRPSETARRRREKFSEKTRCLQRMLPWTKKMDVATVLEEAAKYVRFLQTQVAVLEAMPISSSFGQVSGGGSASASAAGALGMLNRQQMLQVLLNSPVAQTLLSDTGLCVFSYEQLVMLRKLPPSFTNFNV